MLRVTDATQIALASEYSAEIAERDFAVDGITCATCVQIIESELAGIPGLLTARVNYSTRRLHLRWSGANPSRTIFERLHKLGYRVHLLRKTLAYEEQKHAQWLLRCLAVAGFGAMNVMLLSVSVWSGNVSDISVETRDFFHWLSALIVLPAVSYAGQPFFRSALQALLAKRVNMDVPISLGIFLALGLSLYETAIHGAHAYFDSAIMLLFFLLVGRYLEQVTRQRMRNEAHNISALRANIATRIDGDYLVDTEVEDLKPGHVILVRPGDRFPVDGLIIEGNGTIDESIATGETSGVYVSTGSNVLAGTLSMDGSFRVLVQALARNSFVENLERLIDTAISARMPYVQIANRAARLYAPVVHATALLTLIGWLLVGADIHDAMVTAIAVLIITCPCALALAVPTVQVVAMSEMFRQKIIVNSPDFTERLAEANIVVFDKTGTLTLPEASVFNCDLVPSELRNIAASLASASRHPLARAIAKLNDQAVPLANVVEVPGKGVSAKIGEVEARLGSATFCLVPESNTTINENMSSIYLRFGTRTAEFHIGQRLRDDAHEIVRVLRSKGYALMVLSGDKATAVEPIARQLGIDSWRASATPEQKIDTLNGLAQAGCRVLMVGDGLNDAPALASAHVSFSPITAADLTQGQADGLFLGDKLKPVIHAVLISQRAKSMMLQNLGLAVIYNLFAIPLAIFGFVTPLVAAAAMSGSSILVSVNSLRTKKWDARARLSPTSSAEVVTA